MSNVKVKLGSKGMVIALIIGVLLLGGGGAYLLWRVNQEKTVSPTESDAYVPKMCRRCEWNKCTLDRVNGQCTGDANGEHIGCTDPQGNEKCCAWKDSYEYECGVDSYHITFNAGEGGTVSPSGQTTVKANGTITSTATANTGYVFKSWEGSGGGTATGQETNMITVANVTADGGVYTAKFEKQAAETVTLTYNTDGNGKVNGEPTVTQTINKGANGTAVTATANDGYDFDEWSDGNKNSSRTDTNVQESKTYTAKFKAKDTQPGTVTLKYTVSSTIDASQPRGVISPKLNHGKIVNSKGEDITDKVLTINKGADGPPIKAIPNDGYEFAQWCELLGEIEGCQQGGNTPERTERGLSSNKVYIAKFREKNTTPLTNCTGATLTCGENNTILVNWKSLPGTTRYIVRVNKEPADDWVNKEGGDEFIVIENNVLSVTIQNVEPGKIYGINVVPYYGPDEKKHFHESCGITGLGDVWNPPLHQEISCEGTTPIVTPGGKVPDTAIFDDTKDTLLLGFGILIVGLGWTWISTLPKKAYVSMVSMSKDISNARKSARIKREQGIRESRRNRLEKRIK